MTRIIYGGIQLASADDSSRAAIQRYWSALGEIHGVSFEWGKPSAKYLQSSDTGIHAVLTAPTVMRFRVNSGALPTTVSNPAFVTDAGHERTWLRVPLWRCLFIALCHEYIQDAYLILEDLSGDTAGWDEHIETTAFAAISDVWVRNERSPCDDALAYHLRDIA